MRRAVIISLKLMAIAALELYTTFLASKMARMHELAFDKQVRADNRAIAHRTLMCIRANHTLLRFHALWAVHVLGFRFDLVLLSDQICAAAHTDEVLRVE